jgi:hypothetical protein
LLGCRAEVNGTTRWLWDRGYRSAPGRPGNEGDEEGPEEFNVASCYQQSGSDGNAAPHVPVPEVRFDHPVSSSHGAEACNLTGRYLPASLYLSSKLHDRRRDAKHCHRGRHPQEGSRPVGVVHDEKLLAIRPAASDCVIPRHAGKLTRQRLTSDDLAGRGMASSRPGAPNGRQNSLLPFKAHGAFSCFQPPSAAYR